MAGEDADNFRQQMQISLSKTSKKDEKKKREKTNEAKWKGKIKEKILIIFL